MPKEFSAPLYSRLKEKGSTLEDALSADPVLPTHWDITGKTNWETKYGSVSLEIAIHPNVVFVYRKDSNIKTNNLVLNPETNNDNEGTLKPIEIEVISPPADNDLIRGQYTAENTVSNCPAWFVDYLENVGSDSPPLNIERFSLDLEDNSVYVNDLYERFSDERGYRLKQGLNIAVGDIVYYSEMAAIIKPHDTEMSHSAQIDTSVARYASSGDIEQEWTVHRHGHLTHDEYEACYAQIINHKM